MLEGVDRVREELHLVEQLRALEVRQATLQHVLRQPGYPLQQRHGYLGANDSRELHQAFGLQREVVQACRQHCLDGAGQGPGVGVGARLHRGPRQLFQKKGIPCCLRHDRLVLAGQELCCLWHRLHHRQAVVGIERRQRYLRGPGVRQPG